MNSVKIQVIGKVQGVSYRYSTMKKAKSLQLKGWVKNLADGSVEIYAQGLDAAIDSLIEWCYDGPTAASVDNVIIEDLDQTPSPQLESFKIIR